MHRNHIVILDLASQAGPPEANLHLGTMLQRCMADEDIHFHHSTTTILPALPRHPDLVLLRPSNAMPISSVLPSLRKQWAHVPILGLFCAERDSCDDVVRSLRSGLDDFLFYPFRAIDMIPRIQRLLHSHSHAAAGSTGNGLRRFRLASLVGESERFIREVEKIPPLADSDATVLISGETGTGKELFARAIHYHSARKAKPFIPVNCGALPDLLFENELFGHAKGAFTNAFLPQQGLVAEAEGGTLFLDEIDTLSAPAQIKLLRFLQDRQYRPLGSSKSAVADVRIMAATNADLEREIESRRFREDLYYRLKVLSLDIPPLRERIDDVPRLVAYFVGLFAGKSGRGSLRLSAEALQKLLAYSWPGNVRELEGIIQRAAVLTSSPILGPEDIDLPLVYSPGHGDAASLRTAKACAVREFERAYLTKLLTASKGNITRAAKAAGKERRAFQRLVQKHGLDRRVFLDRC